MSVFAGVRVYVHVRVWHACVRACVPAYVCVCVHALACVIVLNCPLIKQVRDL